MKVLLTHGYFLNEDPKEKKIMRPYPPLGLLYISAYLDRFQINNEIFDSTFSSKAMLLARLKEDPPDVLAVYINLMTKTNVLSIVAFVRSNPSLQQTKIIVGGPDVRYNAERLLEVGVDFVVIGEGEESTLELVQAIRDGQPVKGIEGVAWSSNEGAVFNPERKKIKAIDDLPFPNREKIDLELYLNAWKKHHGQSAVSISTMRGCPYTCKWCSRAVYGLSYRRMSPKRVVDELEWIVKRYDPDTFWFVDDVFSVSHKWLEAFRDELKSRNVKVKYECITRADRMNEQVIALLKDSGCFRVWIGAESGSQAVIDRMDRRVDVKQVREMIRLTRKSKIEAGTFIMLGYPGETEEDIYETVRHLKASSPDHFTITITYPIRGTELYKEVEELHIDNYDWKSSSDRDIEFLRTYPRRYYDFAVRWVVNEWRFHQNKEGNRSVIRGLNWKGRAMAARAAMWWVRKTDRSPTAPPAKTDKI